MTNKQEQHDVKMLPINFYEKIDPFEKNQYYEQAYIKI